MFFLVSGLLVVMFDCYFMFIIIGYEKAYLLFILLF